MNEVITTSAEQLTAALAATFATSIDAQRLVAALPWAVLLLDTHDTVLLASPAAAPVWGLPLAALQGARLLEVLPAGPYPVLHELLAAPAPAQAECFLPHCAQWLALATVPLAQGRALFGQDITAGRRAEAAAREQAHLLASISNATPDLLYILDLDPPGISYTNCRVQALLGYSPQQLAQQGAAVFAHLVHPDDYAACYANFQAFSTLPAEEVRTQETRLRLADGQYHWFRLRNRAFRRGAAGQVTHLIGSAQDVQAEHEAAAALQQQRQQAEAERRASHAQLQGVLEAPNVNVLFCEAVRDEAAQVVDLRVVLYSQSAQALFAGPHRATLVGRSLLEALPHQSHLLATYQRVVETGQPTTLALPYQQAGASKWLRLALAKHGDGLVYVWQDLTASRLAELEIQRGQELLQAVFNATTDGIDVFRSVRNRQGEIVDFEWVLNNQVSQKMLHRTDLVGKRWLEELPGMWSLGVFGRHRRVANLGEVAELEWQYQGEELHGWFHSVAVQLGDGLLLTWQDITERKRLQAETLRLQLSQQQQLAQAVLEAEENERRRIAESLHNGLGQLLYATKLSLNQLDLHAPTDFASTKQKVSDLLGAAIVQARTLSHELMPQLLVDFGLEVALQDICAKCSVPPLRMRYRVDDLPPRLSPHLALALYRMAQELANNIVKHAQATRASLQLLGQADGTLELRADDNGLGFVADQPPPGAAGHGMGLQALHDRVRLLRGTLRVHTSPAHGTQIVIRLPWATL